MAKPNNAEARLEVDRDYNGKSIGRLSLLRGVTKEEMEWSYYDKEEEKWILKDGEIVGIHRY